MKIWITAPFQELYLEKLKKDNEVCYENWFDTGIIREGKELAKLLNEKGTEIFVTEEDVVQKEVFEQCPTLKMLVDRDAAITNFKKETYYHVRLMLPGAEAASAKICAAAFWLIFKSG